MNDIHDGNAKCDNSAERDRGAKRDSDMKRDCASEHGAMRNAVPNGVAVSVGMPSNTMRDAEPPTLPRPRMPRSQRAKIFIPFDPLKGYQEALREKECEIEASFDHSAKTQDSGV